MAITVTPTFQGRFVDIYGRFVRRVTLAIAGLSPAGANTVPHGLPQAPQETGLNAGTAGLWGETQLGDGTNLYITIGSGGHPSGWANVKY